MSPRFKFVLARAAVVSAGLLAVKVSPWTRDPPANLQQAKPVAAVVQQLRMAMEEHYLQAQPFPASVEQLELPPHPRSRASRPGPLVRPA
ncbi:MAG: hypothetical protein ACK50Z_13560 [Betaproteobacteria bacterium]|nr:hypothetical protein [Betaproteobacteria bacterium]